MRASLKFSIVPVLVLAAAASVAAAVFLLRPGILPEGGAAPALPTTQYQRIARESPFVLRFPVPMGEESVTEHFSVEPPVEGVVQWSDERTMTFKPAAVLAMSGTYTVTVGAEATRRDGALLGEPLVAKFYVAGAPRVSQVIPPPLAEQVSPLQPVTITFDRPMVPLTTIGEGRRQAENLPVTIEPAIEGTRKWLSTTTLEFTPTEGFAPATEYQVRVPAGITDVLGESVAEETAWSFTTSRPEVSFTDPPNGYDGVSSKVQIVLHFNQDVLLESVAERVAVVRSIHEGLLLDEEIGALQEGKLSPEAAAPVALKVVYGTREEEGKKVTDKSTVVLIPQQPLAWDSWHAVLVRAGVQSPGGTLGSAAPFSAQFHTAGPMRVRSIREEYSGIVIDFTNPYDAKTVKDAVQISPKPEGWDDLEIEENTWGTTSLYLYPTLAPSTEYSVTIGASLKDSFGQPGESSDKPFTFRTPPITPQIFIHSSGTFGVFERGFPPVYYLNAVNVKQLNVSFAKLSFKEFLSDQRAGQSDWQFVPPLAGRSMARTWSIDVPTEENAWASIPFDLEEKVGEPLPSGIYAVTVTAPEYKDPYSGTPLVEKIYFTVSRTALTFKFSGNKALVWAVDMQTGAPVAGADIALHDLNGNTLVTGTTDAEGFLDVPIDAAAFAVDGNTWYPEIWVTAKTENDFAFVGASWTNGMLPGDFGIGEEFQAEAGKQQLMSYLYTDRPIYRAGDTVHFKGILRLKDNSGALAAPAAGRSVRVTVSDGEGTVIFGNAYNLSAFGSFAGELPLDPKASLGTYWMNIEFEDGSDLTNNWGSTTFEVLAYRKPEYRVDVSFDREDAFSGDTVRAAVEGAYYFGMPMDGAQVEWRAITTDYFFNQYTDGWYSFSLEDAWCWYDCERETKPIADGKGTLDAGGKFTIDVPVDLEEEALSQVLSIDVDVTDESNQVVSTRASIPVHKAGVYVGIRPEEYAVEPGEEAGIALVTVLPDGSVAANRRVDLTVFKRTWNTLRKKGVDGLYYYDNEPSDERVQTLSVTTGEDGKVSANVRIPSGGQFRVLASVRDSSGRESKADTSVYAWSSMYINWPHSNSNRMTVLADKPKYTVGETAKLLVQSPFQGSGVTALITVEREGILSRRVIPVTSSAQPFEVPITENLIPNAYVSVVVVKPRAGETFNENGLDTGAPAFRIGYVKLKVETESKGLTVSITPNKRQYLPGEQVEVELTTEDWRGNPMPAEVSLAAVDMSVLALTGFRVPDLLDVFYADRGLGVRTAQNLLYILERFKPGSKGGGGGSLEERARGNFQDTAYWNPSIITDERGKATVQFTLPDNLTTWQLLAIGHTRGSQVGALAQEILETKRVILRPVRPRFAVQGDSADLAAIVHNGTEEERTFTVSLSGSGFIGSAAAQTVTIAAQGQEKVTFPVIFGNDARAAFVFMAEGGDARDEIHEQIPLLPLGIPHAVATSGFTDEATATEKLYVPVRDEVTGVQAEATLSPTLATYLPKGLEYLVQFPYGCAEQTVSSFLPNIAVAQLQGFDAFKIVSAEELDEKVVAGLERLATFQRPDGGFGYWQDSSESYPYLTAYILHALELTREAGYAIDGGVAARAHQYLQEVLRDHSMDRRLDLSERAYILYVLGETGSPDTGLLSNLYGKRSDLPIFAKAYLAMGLQRAGESRRAQNVLQEILQTASVSPRGVRFEERDGWEFRSLMNTDQRTTALVLQTMMSIDPKNDLIPNVVRAMLAMREQGHWDTTQSTVASIVALVDYLHLTGELEGDFIASLSVSDREIAQAAFNAANILTRKTASIPETAMQNGQLNPVEIRKEGTGRLYYDLLLTYFWKAKKIDPAEEGISIVREIIPVAGAPETPAVGATYKVKLTVTVPESRYFVAVESPHPAGMEGIDFSLKTSQQHLEDELEMQREGRWWWDPSWYFNHKEFRDDQVFLFADELPAGVYHYEYLLRATLPGTFQWRPARAYEMYFPEVFGNTASATMEIRDTPQS